MKGDAYDFPKCLGLECKNLILANGEMIKNPRDPNMTIYIQHKLDPNAYENPDYYYYYPDSEPHEYGEQYEGQLVGDETPDEDVGVDVGDDGDEKKYCDVVERTGEPYDTCHDRKDYSDTTGLYTCIDGSQVKDWSVHPNRHLRLTKTNILVTSSGEINT
jgi:hypothetical protein